MKEIEIADILTFLIAYLIGVITLAIIITVLCYINPTIAWSPTLKLRLVCQWY
jgi:hypothetical protein